MKKEPTTAFHGKRIGSDALVEATQIEVDEKALAPFYSRMIDVAKQKLANHSPVPTPSAVH